MRCRKSEKSSRLNPRNELQKIGLIVSSRPVLGIELNSKDYFELEQVSKDHSTFKHKDTSLSCFYYPMNPLNVVFIILWSTLREVGNLLIECWRRRWELYFVSLGFNLQFTAPNILSPPFLSLFPRVGSHRARERQTAGGRRRETWRQPPL